MRWCGEVQQGFGKGLFPYAEGKLFYGLLADTADASPCARAAAH